jgi:hypothetical protein
MNDARVHKENVERDYDALITRLNRCQGQLANKAAQSQKLSLDDYRTWFDKKKQDLSDIQQAIQAKKGERSEARRKFNSWAPAHKEDWIRWPDCEGWWWFHGARDDAVLPELDVYFFCLNDNDKLVVTTGENDDEDLLTTNDLRGKFQFLPTPDLPK